MDSPPWVGFRAYLLAAICVGISFVLRLALDPVWGDRFPYVIFFVGVFVVVQLADIGPALTTLLASVLLADWFFVPPRHSLLISGRTDQVNTVLFCLISFVILYFSLRTRRALGRERAARDRLQRHIEALRESEARYSSVIENSMDAIFLTDQEGRILAANRGAHRMFRQAEEQLRGLRLAALVDPQRREPVVAAEHKSEQCSAGLVAVALVRGDGTRFTGEMSIGSFTDRNGLPKNISIIRDLTERRRTEQEREHLVQ
ncbi:MAG: PAS domain S-box protein [Verrucomicrobia bacterium]|nr:PAS domain S-box protein [Verrucomicrobiota bacterium]